MIFLLAYADDVFGSYLIDQIRKYGENQHKHDWFICIKIQINTITSVHVYKQNKLVLNDKNKKDNPLEIQSSSPFDQQMYRRLVISADMFVVFQTRTLGPKYAKLLLTGIRESGNDSLCCLKLEAERVQSLVPLNQVVTNDSTSPNSALSSELYAISQSDDTVRLPLEDRTMQYPKGNQAPNIAVILDWLRGHISGANINPLSDNLAKQLLQQGRELAPIVSELQLARSQYSFDDSLEKEVNAKYAMIQHLWTNIMQDSRN